MKSHAVRQGIKPLPLITILAPNFLPGPFNALSERPTRRFNGLLKHKALVSDNVDVTAGSGVLTAEWHTTSCSFEIGRDASRWYLQNSR